MCSHSPTFTRDPVLAKDEDGTISLEQSSNPNASQDPGGSVTEGSGPGGGGAGQTEGTCPSAVVVISWPNAVPAMVEAQSC